MINRKENNNKVKIILIILLSILILLLFLIQRDIKNRAESFPLKIELRFENKNKSIKKY